MSKEEILTQIYKNGSLNIWIESIELTTPTAKAMGFSGYA